MDHFINVPIDQAGLIPDPRLAAVVAEAMQKPFDFSDVFLYSHGWWSTAGDAMTSYTRFSVQFASALCAMDTAIIPLGPRASFGIGIFWPSMLSDSDRELVNAFEPLSYYQMERRSDDVGFNAVFALLQTIYMMRQRGSSEVGLKLTLIGHSFGCRVLCQALDRLYCQIMKEGTSDDYRRFVLSSRINLVLLQAAFESDDLEPGERYGHLRDLAQLRVLVTTSQLDLALKNLFPLAEHINILSSSPGTREALGYRGPSVRSIDDFSCQSIALSPGFIPSAQPLLFKGSRMLVADITALHQASTFNAGPLSGHHCDIFLPEIYKLIAKFSFQ